MPARFFNAFDLACGQINHFWLCFGTLWRAVVYLGMAPTVVISVHAARKDVIELLFIYDAERIENLVLQLLNYTFDKGLDIGLLMLGPFDFRLSVRIAFSRREAIVR